MWLQSVTVRRIVVNATFTIITTELDVVCNFAGSCLVYVIIDVARNLSLEAQCWICQMFPRGASQTLSNWDRVFLDPLPVGEGLFRPSPSGRGSGRGNPSPENFLVFDLKW